MKLRILLLLSAIAFGAVLIIPDLLSIGATGHLDSSGALAAGHFGVAFGLVFAGGILTALTPCVFPLIPITVAILSGQAGGAGPSAGTSAAPGAGTRSRKRAAAVTSFYVLGMVVTFDALAVTAVLTGKAFGSALSSPVVSVVLAGFFVALAFSMFGAFEIKLPTSLTQRFNRVGGAGYAGGFAMGLVAGLVAAPCTGPVLFSILTYVAVHQSLGLGLGLLSLYALGIGVPFFVIGVFSFSLGKSGPWMDAVKSLVGIVLLAMAVVYLRDAFPGFAIKLPPGTLAVYAVAALVALGVFVGAIHRSFHGTPGERWLKATGLVCVVLGLTARLDVESMALAQAPTGIAWVHDLDAALASAKAAHKPVFVDFYADWCASCKELDRKTYPDARIQEAAKRFVAVKVDGTHESAALDKVYDKYGIEGLPTVIFVGSDGTLLADPRVVGFVTPTELLGLFKRVQ